MPSSPFRVPIEYLYWAVSSAEYKLIICASPGFGRVEIYFCSQSEQGFPQNRVLLHSKNKHKYKNEYQTIKYNIILTFLLKTFQIMPSFQCWFGYSYSTQYHFYMPGYDTLHIFNTRDK